MRPSVDAGNSGIWPSTELRLQDGISKLFFDFPMYKKHNWAPCSTAWEKVLLLTSLMLEGLATLSTNLLPSKENSICNLVKSHIIGPKVDNHCTPKTKSQQPKGNTVTLDVNLDCCNFHEKPLQI